MSFLKQLPPANSAKLSPKEAGPVDNNATTKSRSWNKKLQPSSPGTKILIIIRIIRLKFRAVDSIGKEK